MDQCLTSPEIEQFVSGDLSPQARDRAEAHLGRCAECRQKRERVEADRKLFGHIKQAVQTAESGEPDAERETLTVDLQGSPADVFDRIEGYEILSEIHRGGQGIVYKAVQKATKRTIALKVLLEGRYATPHQRYRFEREIDLVASLQHPNIVTVYDSGVTKDNRHYFAMEYIHGRTLNRYLRDVKLSLDDKLGLFQRICDAVGHAHTRGVIHRDLKPSNIRVDASGAPHILDFGLAKAAGPNLMERGAPVTMTGEFMGTLAYAAPEQTKGDPNLIDIRTDVYALGVILYEMLTKKPPYPVDGRIDEIIKTINDVDPKRPSSLNTKINDEVETIVLKALEKEPERRYLSAAALADDINRYLHGEAIDAKRASSLYMLRKAVHRYRRPAVVGLLFTIVVVVSAVFVWRYSRLQAATRLVHEASRLIDHRENLQRAHELLDESLDTHSAFSPAYFYRGLLNTIEGLNAELKYKATFIDEAITDFEQAHRAAGGQWPDLTAAFDNEEGLGQRGSSDALAAAARLYGFRGRGDETRRLFTVAMRVSNSRDDSDTTRRTLSPTVYQTTFDRLVGEVDLHSPMELGLEAERDASLVQGLSQKLNSLNPFLATSQAEFVTELLFDTLVNVAAYGQYTDNKAMIHPVEISDDRRRVTVRLKPGLTWHNDKPVEAADVVFSWRQLGDDHVSRSGFAEVYEQDSSTVVFSSSTPIVDPRWDLFFPIISRKHFAALSELYPGLTDNEIHEHYSRDAVGNGPYRLDRPFDPSQTEIVLERWEGYSGPSPYMKKIRFRVIEDQEKRIRALADGKLDLLELKANEFRWHVNGQSFDPVEIRKINVHRWNYDYICWNETRPYFDNLLVRRALTMAINLRRIITDYHNDLYTAFSSKLHPGSWAAGDRPTAISYDPNEAAGMLDQAGWRMGEDGIRRKSGHRFEFALLVPDRSIETIGVLEAIKGYLRDVGVIMKVKPIAWKNLVARRNAEDFDAFVGSVIVSAHPDRSRWRWVKDGAANYGGYFNFQVDELYDKARREPDNNKRAEIYREIDRLVYQDQPYTFLWWRPVLAAMNPRLKGVKVGHRGLVGFYPGAREWWFPRETN